MFVASLFLFEFVSWIPIGAYAVIGEIDVWVDVNEKALVMHILSKGLRYKAIASTKGLTSQSERLCLSYLLMPNKTHRYYKRKLL